MIFNLRGGAAWKVPVLNSSYPADKTIDVGGSATFNVQIATEGKPDEYTYQWYLNGSAVSGATGRTFTKTSVTKGTHSVYCIVTNKAGSVKSRTATLTAKRLYLFNNGDECTSVTNGWTAKACRPTDSNVSLAPTKVVSGGTMQAKIEVGSYGRAGVVQTAKAIDLSPYSTLYFHVTNVYNPEDKNCVGVMETFSGDTFAYLASAVAKTGTISVNVSSIKDARAVCLAVVCNRYEIYGSSSVTVDSVYLE